MSVLKLSSKQQYISKSQFCKACHVGTETAAWLIKKGLVPAIVIGAKTKHYLIAREDAERYLDEREKFPEKYGYKYRTYGKVGKYNRSVAKRIKDIVQSQWEDEHDLLDISEVSRLIGYRTETVYRWHIRYNIASVLVDNKLYIPKNELVRFVGSREFCEVEHKSKIHYDLIKNAFNEQ